MPYKAVKSCNTNGNPMAAKTEAPSSVQEIKWPNKTISAKNYASSLIYNKVPQNESLCP